eukprot:3378881-Rhodomonas_salina.2
MAGVLKVFKAITMRAQQLVHTLCLGFSLPPPPRVAQRIHAAMVGAERACAVAAGSGCTPVPLRHRGLHLHAKRHDSKPLRTLLLPFHVLRCSAQRFSASP